MSNVPQAIGRRIRKHRDAAGLSQQELADRMGLLRPAVSQIESGERKINAEELIKLKHILKVDIDVLLGETEEADVVLAPGRVEAKEAKPELRINVPQKHLAKFKEVLLYILTKVGSKPNIGETVLYKLLYFIDFNHYEQFEKQLMGATYIKNHFGPTPVEFSKIIKKMEEDDEVQAVKVKHFKYDQRRYIPLRAPDLSVLNGQEMETIDDVLRRLSDMSAKQISEYSHEDVPWKTGVEGKPIEYEAVFYRTPAYSVRKDSDDVPADPATT